MKMKNDMKIEIQEMWIVENETFSVAKRMKMIVKIVIIGGRDRKGVRN